MKQKIVSILIIMSLVFSGFFILGMIPENGPISNASAEVWTETSDLDFSSGTLNNVEVIGIGDGAKLQLKTKNELGVWHQRNLKPPELFEHAMAYDSANNKVVLFGGLDSTYNDETWVYEVASDTWTQKNPSIKPSGRVRTAMAYDSANKKVMLFGGYDSTIYDDTWVYDVTLDTWTQMNPSTKPSARQIHAMAYDSANNKVVMFGGYDGSSRLNDTWVYDLASDTWTQKNPSPKPPARTKFTMVYDSYNKKTVLFGGGISSGRTDDTWVYDLVSDTWTQKNPSTKPSARMEHIMAYDSLNKKVVLFGGFDGSYDNETWVYDVASDTWTQKNPSNKPSGRISPAMAFDSANNKVVLFGGYELSDPDDETWVYDVALDTWTQKSPSIKPSARTYHTMAYDSTNNRVILFGGYDGTLVNDTWVYDVATDTWTRKNPSTKPSSRYGHAMVYDSANNKVVLFGGYDGTSDDETWVYDLATDTWSQKNPSTKPSARRYHAMAYDSTNNKIVMFGGNDETWAYDVASDTWTQKSPSTKPSARSHHAMAYDSLNKKVVLFGGYISGFPGGRDDETWVYDLVSDTWTQKSLSTKPTARQDHAMVYDSTNNKVVLFGANIGFNSYDDETWVYDVTTDTWTQKSLSTKPSARSHHAMAFDSANNKVMLFGGADSGGRDDETWVYNMLYYYNTGSYTSKIYTAINLKWHKITWRTNTYPDGFIRFQVAVNDDGKTWNYIGPDGTSLTYYDEVTGGILYSGYDGEFLRYKAYFTTPLAGNTPELSDVSIIYITEGPSVKLTSPNGGEDWMKDEYYPITWDAEGIFDSNPINLYYSVDNGANWILIAEGVFNAGFYNWTVPNIETSNALIAVEAIDIYGNLVIDTSDTSFAIDPPPSQNKPSGSEVDKPVDNLSDKPNINDETEVIIPSNPQKMDSNDLDFGLMAGVFMLVICSIIIMILTILLVHKSRRSKASKIPIDDKTSKKRKSRLISPIIRKKIFSFLIIVSLIFTGFFILGMIPEDGLVINAKAETWTETSDVDFGNGILDNVEVIGTGDGAKLQLKTKHELGIWHKRHVCISPSPRELHAMAYDSANNKVVLFGGFFNIYDDETWVYDLASDTWTQKNPTTKPSARRDHAMVYDSTNNKVVLFGGLGGGNETWVYDVSSDTWTQKNPTTKPSARRDHAMVYDSTNNKVVLFGGYNGTRVNDTWVYDVASNIWTQKNPTTKPLARYNHAMAYDSANNKVVLFGGYDTSYDNETWVYDVANNTWVQKNPSTKPSGRIKHEMVYDSANNKMVLFGGVPSLGGIETWVYDVASDNWTKKNPSIKPTVVDGHAMAYDSTNNKVVLFGGWIGTFSDETWAYDLSSDTWTQKCPYPTPPARYGHAMAYDSVNNKVVLYGGYDGTNRFYDTWVYNVPTDNWTKKSHSTQPSARYGHAMAYDSANNKVVLFGGYDSTYDDETWVYDVELDTWTKKSPSTKPLARAGHAMVYDSANNKIVLFGGYDTTYDNETWVYDVALDTWSQMSPSTKPSARYYHAMAYDSVNNKVVLYGGFNGIYDNETWVYDFISDNWTQKSPSIKPSGRYGHAMAYNSVNNKVVLFGGVGSSYYNEIWVYDVTLDTWTQKCPSTKPSARFFHTMAYDSVNNKVVLFGGTDSSGKNAEPWVYNINDYYNTGIYTSGTYTSNINKWYAIGWTTNTIHDGFIRFQVAVNNDGKTWNYIGPDGTSSTYYDDDSGGILYWGYEGQFLRYKAYFTTPTAGNSPELFEVSITYITEGPSVKLTSPNGGEDWMKEEFYPITWDAEGDFNSISINLYYSVDNGANWTSIARGILNTGFYNWTVPNIETANALIVVRAIDKYGNSVFDTSDASFAIDPPPPEYKPSVGEIGAEETIDDKPGINDEPKDSIPSSSQGKGGNDLELGLVAGAFGLVVISIIIMLFTIFLIYRSKNPRNTKTSGEPKNRGKMDLRIKLNDKNKKFKGGVK